jgi:hypothetical protein
MYEYALCYVDDCIFQVLDPMGFMDYLRMTYTVKDGNVQEQEEETYLCADIQRDTMNLLMELRLGQFLLTPMCDVKLKRDGT